MAYGDSIDLASPSAIANAIFRGSGFPAVGYERSWISLSSSIFSAASRRIRRQRRRRRRTVRCRDRSRIIGKATILFHLAHTRHTVSRVRTATETHVRFDPRGLYSVTVIRKRPTRRERDNRIDTWAHTDNGFSNIKREHSHRELIATPFAKLMAISPLILWDLINYCRFLFFIGIPGEWRLFSFMIF